ncbi:MAG: two-component system, chemotaxis family, protein-glutamate methylesterase/glutaminase [Chloroflexota bacterium]|nr:two-component system, chemotaxis family, protein-glutamate methylesterase/glutaminase [Chloroflexota bacterium]
MDRIIRVLVVDDSAYVRKVVRQMLSRSPFIEVVGIAHDGIEALELVEELKPDVVTLDLIMPRMDGLGFLQAQMARRPLPVIICSIASESGEMALKALELGAIDFIQKPTALATERVFEISDDLIEKVKTAAQIALRGKTPGAARGTPPVALDTAARQHVADAVVLGISTGGPQALRYLIPQIPADFPAPIAMVLHMPVGYTEMYAAKLNEISRIQVSEAHEGDVMRPGIALLAPAGRHLSLTRNAEGAVVAHLDARPFDTPHRPAVDVLFRSAADVYHNRLLGVVMTGMGSDGMQGAAWIKAQGGLVFTEAEESCVVYGMPRSVVEAGLSDRAVPLDRMAQAIMETV